MRNTSFISSTLGDYYSPDTKIIFIFAEQVYSISICFPAVLVDSVAKFFSCTSDPNLPAKRGPLKKSREVLPITAHMGRFHLKGVPFSGLRCIKGHYRDFTSGSV